MARASRAVNIEYRTRNIEQGRGEWWRRIEDRGWKAARGQTIRHQTADLRQGAEGREDRRLKMEDRRWNSLPQLLFSHSKRCRIQPLQTMPLQPQLNHCSAVAKRALNHRQRAHIKPLLSNCKQPLSYCKRCLFSHWQRAHISPFSLFPSALSLSSHGSTIVQRSRSEPSTIVNAPISSHCSAIANNGSATANDASTAIVNAPTVFLPCTLGRAGCGGFWSEVQWAGVCEMGGGCSSRLGAHRGHCAGCGVLLHLRCIFLQDGAEWLVFSCVAAL